MMALKSSQFQAAFPLAHFPRTLPLDPAGSSAPIPHHKLMIRAHHLPLGMDHHKPWDKSTTLYKYDQTVSCSQANWFQNFEENSPTTSGAREKQTNWDKNNLLGGGSHKVTRWLQRDSKHYLTHVQSTTGLAYLHIFETLHFLQY